MGLPYDKTNLKLDLENRASVNSRKRKFLSVAAASPALLQSPDLKLLKLGSPELEKLIINNNGFLPTPTPGGSNFLNGENTSEDKESFARGFIEALQKLQEQDVPFGWDPNMIRTESPRTSVISPPKWQVDQNRNTVGVTTPVITPLISSRFETQSPPLPKLPTSTPVLINFPSASSGAISTMGVTAIPRSSTSYVTRPMTGNLSYSSYNQQSSSHSLTTSGMTLPSQVQSTSLSSFDNTSIKSEDEAVVPSNASNSGDNDLDLDMNPIDLDAQEHIKHQRKKLRNRLAAQRCRKRKIEREDTLKIKVKELKNKNTELTSLASTLRMQVCDLKQKVMHHVNEGCQVFLKDSEEEKQLLSKNV